MKSRGKTDQTIQIITNKPEWVSWLESATDYHVIQITPQDVSKIEAGSLLVVDPQLADLDSTPLTRHSLGLIIDPSEPIDWVAITNQWSPLFCISIDMSKSTVKTVLKKAIEDPEPNQDMQFKSQFLAQISHDLRTPLHVILGTNALLAKMPLVKAHSLHEPLETVQKSAERMLRLINDLLDLSKMECGKMEVILHPVSIGDILSSYRPMMASLLQDKLVQFHLENKIPAQTIIQTDQKKLNQILTNLLSNAAKFTDSGSVTLTATLNNNDLVVQVSDTGIGIDDRAIRHVFDPYFQSNPRSSMTHHGTGLGLAICKGFVEALGGQIQLESATGVGTTVTFDIPVQIQHPIAPDNQEGGSGQDIDVSGLKNKRVLVCDDDMFNQQFIKMALKDRCRLTQVMSGNAAVSAVSSQGFDIVLMDIQMPGLDGRETLGQIRQTQADMPIIAVTAQAMKGDRENLLKSGFTDYLSKPFSEEDLLKILVQYQQ